MIFQWRLILIILKWKMVINTCMKETAQEFAVGLLPFSWKISMIFLNSMTIVVLPLKISTTALKTLPNASANLNVKRQTHMYSELALLFKIWWVAPSLSHLFSRVLMFLWVIISHFHIMDLGECKYMGIIIMQPPLVSLMSTSLPPSYSNFLPYVTLEMVCCWGG